MTEEILDLLGEPPVEEAQGEAHGTDSFALVTPDTATGEVKRTTQVEKVLLRQLDADIHPQPIVPLKHAGRAVATGTDLTAGIATNAAVELCQPELQPRGRFHRVDLVQIAVLVPARFDLWRFTEQRITDYRDTVNAASAANG
jgi:hypothetical protein